MLAEIGRYRPAPVASQIRAYRPHASSVMTIDITVPAIAPTHERRHEAVSADISAALPSRLNAVIAGSDVGLAIQISSPRMARVANELSSRGGGVIMGLIASQTPMGIPERHRLVQTGTSNSGVVAQRDHALTGWQCLSKIQRRAAAPFTCSRLGACCGAGPARREVVSPLYPMIGFRGRSHPESFGGVFNGTFDCCR